MCCLHTWYMHSSVFWLYVLCSIPRIRSLKHMCCGAVLVASMCRTVRNTSGICMLHSLFVISWWCPWLNRLALVHVFLYVHRCMAVELLLRGSGSYWCVAAQTQPRNIAAGCCCCPCAFARLAKLEETFAVFCSLEPVKQLFSVIL